MITKSQLIKEMAKKGNIKICEAEKYMNLFIDTLIESLKEDGSVKIRGFGKFQVKEFKEKTARNFMTSESVTVPKHKKVKFTVSKILNDSLN